MDEFEKIHGEEIEFCESLPAEENALCKKLNEQFYKFIQSVDQSYPNKEKDADGTEWEYQATPIIGYMDTGIKRGEYWLSETMRT